MHPEILTIGPLSIRGYGLMLAIGFLAGILIAARRAERLGEDPDHIYNLSVWIVFSSLVGARIYYVITHFNEFRGGSLFATLKNMFWPVGADGTVGISGLILYGGLIGATVVAIGYLRWHRLKVTRYLDIIGPSLGIGEFFTRIGCFLNGCCYGKPTSCWTGVVFPPESAAGYYYPHIHIHPSQLYNAFAGITIFVLLLVLERWKKFDGYTALNYFILYSIGRFTIDFTRYYEEGMIVRGLSQNQILSLVIFICAGGLLIFNISRAKKSAGERIGDGSGQA